METRVFPGDTGCAAELLRNGGLVAVPTETVYGLAADGTNAEAVHKIYEVKGRPEVKPLSLMVPGKEAIEQYCCEVPRQAYVLAEAFWPGPLTIVLKAQNHIPPVVLAGGTTVGLRCPDHPLTLKVLREAGVPLAAPSANPSGEASPKDAPTVLGYFDGIIDGIIDGGPCGIGKESTLVSLTEKPFRILRQGALPAENIADALVKAMHIIGITGQSGAGKTTALQVLEKHGALIIDCDALYHELLAANEELIAALAEVFPTAVSGKHVDRRALGRLVFGDSEKLERLNRITHGFVTAEVKMRLREHAMNGGSLAAIDAVELIGSGLAEQCEAVWGVTAEEKVRLARITGRDGITPEAALARIRAQKTERYYIDHCTHVLQNNGSLEEFNELCEKSFGGYEAWTN